MDASSKETLRNIWPLRTSLWSGRAFFRVQPVDDTTKGTAPRIFRPGSDTFATQPDGLYARLFNEAYCDLIVIEVCGNRQNLADKRSRYQPSTSSLLLECSAEWLKGEVAIQGGGKRSRWALSELDAPKNGIRRFAIRHMRVLYAIPTGLYTGWKKDGACEAHEYFCKESSLASYKSQKMRSFLESMSPEHHYYTQK